MQALELLFAKLFKKNYVDIKTKIKACLLYYLGLSLRKAAKLLNISHEAVRKIYKRARKIFNPKKKKRKVIAIDETKLYGFYVFAAIDINSNEIIAIYASKGRSSLDALIFMKKVLKACIAKPQLILCDRGPWYIYALRKLGLNYRHETFGLRNAIERWFFLLKHRTKKFYNCFHAKGFAGKFKAVYEFCLSFAALYNLFYARRVVG